MISRCLNPVSFSLILLVSLLTSNFNSANATNDNNNFSFTILHSNDLHSHEDSFLENGRVVGGMARIAHLIKMSKAKSNKVLAIDAGDIFQGTPYFEEYHGKSDIECLNKAGYDIYTIGNHEFDNGPKNLTEALKLAQFSVISANLDATSEPALAALIKPSVIKTIDGEKVAFVGAITPYLSEVSTKLQGVKLKATGGDWLNPIKNEIAKLKAEGINKFVIVSHCGIELEKMMAELLPDVDVVIGGHSHTRLDKPIVLKHLDGSQAIVVQTGSYGRALGKLDLVFDKDGNLSLPKTQYRLINITDRIFEDPELSAYIAEKGKPFEKLKSTIAGYAEANFDNRFKNYPGDSPIGDLVCDALLDAGKEQGATIAMQNRGGIRCRIDQGPISLEKVREMLPFENRLKVATISGSSLMKVLENSVSGMLGARFLDFSGIKMAYDPQKESDNRVIFAYTQNKDSKWEKVKATDFYRVAINDYNFNGGEEYDFKAAKDVVACEKKLSQIFEEYLRKVKKVKPALPSHLVAASQSLVKQEDCTGGKKFIVNYPSSRAEYSIVLGSSPGVEFLPSAGTVPLSKAWLGKSGIKLNTNGESQLSSSDILRCQKQSSKDPLWFCVILQNHEPGEGPRKIVSAPIQIR